MSYIKIDFEPYPSEEISSGIFKVKLETGVAVLTDFVQEAIWVDPNQRVVTLAYNNNQTAAIEHGLPVDNNLTIPQLQSICTQIDLSIEGTQQELIDRIKDHLNT